VQLRVGFGWSGREVGFLGRFREWYEKLTDLSCFVKILNQDIARYTNALDGKRGHVIGERFKSVLIEDGVGLLQRNLSTVRERKRKPEFSRAEAQRKKEKYPAGTAVRHQCVLVMQRIRLRKTATGFLWELIYDSPH
jgi:hypothetical protein